MLKKVLKSTIIGLNFFLMFVLGWTAIDKSNPLYIYGAALPVQELKAYLEASDLKPHWQFIAKNKGDCRIQNTIAAIENPNLYIVFGKLYDPKTGASGDHQWTTLNPENPGEYKYIVDRTTGLSTEKRKRAVYKPYVVYKFNADTCTIEPVKAFKEFTDDEKFLIKSGEFYVRSFCKYYKERYKNEI